MISYRKIVDTQEIKEYLCFFNSILPNLKNRVSIDKYAKKLADNAEVYIMIENGKDIGILVFYANDFVNSNAYLTIIGISKDFQNKHYGHKLLSFCELECYKKKMKVIRLEVRKERKYAIRFYLNNGFSIYDKNEEFLYMQKELKNI